MGKITSSKLKKIQGLNQQAWDLSKKDRQGALELARQAQTLLADCAQAQPLDEFECLKTQAYCYDRLSQPEQALSTALRANLLAEQIGDNFLISTIQGILGRICWHIDDFPTSMDYYLNALKLVSTTSHPELEITLINGLGLVQYGLGNYSESLKHFMSCLEKADKNDHASLSDANNNIAYVLHMLGRDQEALEYGMAALSVHKQLGAAGGIMETLHSLGAIHLSLGNYDQALALLRDGIELSRQNNSQLLEVTYSLEISRALQITGKLVEAEKECLPALQIAEKINSLTNISLLHECLAEIYKEKQDYQSALDHFQAFHAAYTKIFNEKSAQRVKHLEILHQIDMTHKQADLYRGLAETDILTSLVNRRGFLQNFSQTIARSKRQQSYGALLFIDLNKFKQLNDTHGHEAGDRLLIAVADRLRAAVRASDTVARLGGDEFVVLLEGLGSDQQTASESASTMAEKIRQLLNEEYELGDIRHHATASIGITLFLGDGMSIDQILKNADADMYADKRNLYAGAV